MLNSQVTTDWRLPNAVRNQIVKEAVIRCRAVDCTNQATRWSNLCGHCEVQYLNWNMPIFGKPTDEQFTKAKALIRTHLTKDIESGVLDSWVSQVARTMYRPEAKAVPPLRLKDMQNPKDRLEPILAWRAKGRMSKGVSAQGKTLKRTGVINLLAYALAIDTFITPTIVQPLRHEYLFHLLGMRFMGRKAIAQTKLRYSTKLIKTGLISYTPNGPVEQTQRIEVEEPETTSYRIKRADFRLIGRTLWNTMAKILLAGGRTGMQWRGLQDELRSRLSG